MTGIAIPPPAAGTTMRMDPRALCTFHRNPHRGDVGAIMASLLVNGQYKPIVVNAGTYTGRRGEVLAGNHTLIAFRHLAEQDPHDERWHEIAVHVVDVGEQMANRIVLVDNRSFELGEGVDPAAVLALVAELDSAVGTGYTAADLDALEASLSASSGGRDGEAGEGGGVPEGEPEKPPPPPSPTSERPEVIGYTIVFDTEAQQRVWFEFANWLELAYPSPNWSPSRRLTAFLSEMPPERRI